MTQTFLITTARDAARAGSLSLPCGFLCYRIGAKGILQRTPLPPATRGGLLGIFEAPGLAAANPDVLPQSIAAECSHRGYGGVILDLQPSHDALNAFTTLCMGLQRQNIPVFVPESLAAAAPGCRVILPGAVSGGTFEEMLDLYKARYGPDRICLDLQRCCHSFTMPSYTPEGRRLTRQELQELQQQYQPNIFFSPELCTRYFTYRPQNQALQFVLFDDPDTAAQRLRQAAAQGIRTCFLLYSEWGSSAKAITAASVLA